MFYAMRPCIAAVVLFGLSLIVQAQSNNWTLKGRVVDANNAAVSGASITIERTEIRFERAGITDSNGDFSFDGLDGGSYKVVVTATGFAEATKTVSLSSSGPGPVEFTLNPETVLADVSVAASHFAGTEEALTRTPGAIDLIDARTLETSRVFNFSEALRKVSGLNVRDEEGFGLRPNIGIRGTNPTRSTKVLLLEDGIPLAYAPYGDNASYYHPPIERFESIEVLKGSGQIAYGPVTVAGVVNYITPNPPSKSTAIIKLIGGNRNYANGSGQFGTTLGRTGLIFNFAHKQGLGARENVRSRLDDFSFKAVHALTDNQSLTFKTSYYNEESNVTYSGLTLAEYNTSPRQNPFRNDFFYGKRFGASVSHSVLFRPNLFMVTNLYVNHFDRDWWRQSSNSGERPNRLFSLAGGESDCRGMQDLNTTCGNQGRQRSYLNWGLEPRLTFDYDFGEVRNELNVGVRIHYENQDRIQQNGSFPTARSTDITNSSDTVESNIRKNFATSGFIQNRFVIGQFAITPGVRVEHIWFRRIDRRAGNFLTPTTGRTQLTQVIPGLGIAYNVLPRTTIFAGAHRGYAPPRTEDIITNAGGVFELDPELSWNYEAGVRSRPVTGLSVEGAFFRLDYENQIVAASVAGGTGAAFTNGGATLHQGFETNSQLDTGAIFQSQHNLYLRAAYMYLPTAEFVGRRFSNITGGVLVTGNRLPYAPKHNLTTSIGYSHPIGLDGFIEGVYVGRQFTDDLNTINVTANGQRGVISSATYFNATANYTVEKWRTTFFVTGKNIFDRLYIVDRTRGILPGSPRLVQAGLKFRLFN